MKKIKKSALLFAVLLLFCFCLFGCSDQTHISYESAGRYQSGGASLEGTVSAVDVEWLSGTVQFAQAEGMAVTFTETANTNLTEKTSLHYWLEGTVLHIRYAATGRYQFHDLKKDITISLPAGVTLERLDAQVASGDVVVDRIRATDVSIAAVSGKVYGTFGDDVKNLAVETVSGSVDMAAKSIGTFRLSTVSGALALSCENVPETGKAESVSGNITIQLPQSAFFKLRYQALSGDLKTDYETTAEEGKEMLCGKMTGDSLAAGESLPLYDVTTTSGRVYISARPEEQTSDSADPGKEE